MNRRRFLTALGPPLLASMAGCGGDSSDRTTVGTPESTTPTDRTMEPMGGSGDPDATPVTARTVIDDPGVYELAEDLSGSETGIEITASAVVLNGRGHTIRGTNPAPDQHGIRVTGDDVTVSNVAVRGWNENGAGVLFESTTGGEISNVTAAENFHGVRLALASDAVVTDNELVGNGEFGLLADASESTTVDRNTVTGNVESGILLWESANNRIAGNTVADNRLRNHLGGIHLDGDRTGSNGNEIAGNELRDNGDTAVILIGSDENDVTDNAMEANGRHGIFLEGASDNTLANNTATGNAITGIDLAWESDQNTIRANTLEQNDGHGIWLIDSHGNAMENNAIAGNDQIGIILADASENTIAANSVTNNRQGGIDLIGESEYTPLVGSHDNEVLQNEVLENEGREGSGIRLLHSNENQLRGNTVRRTRDHGINVFESVGNELTDNRVIGNEGDGIHLELATENVVVSSNVVERNRNGVAVGRESTEGVSIDGNAIVNHAEYGVVVRDMPADEVPDESDDIENVDAIGNWWGHETGPSHPEKNPSGAGDRVSDNVDFDPWNEQAP